MMSARVYVPDAGAKPAAAAINAGDAADVDAADADDDDDAGYPDDPDADDVHDEVQPPPAHALCARISVPTDNRLVFDNYRIFIMHCARLRIHTANPLYLLCARVCVCRSGFQMGLEMLTQFGQVCVHIAFHPLSAPYIPT